MRQEQKCHTKRRTLKERLQVEGSGGRGREVNIGIALGVGGAQPAGGVPPSTQVDVGTCKGVD